MSLAFTIGVDLLVTKLGFPGLSSIVLVAVFAIVAALIYSTHIEHGGAR